jgi:predicted CXXCH cytochrome family protein
VSNTVIRNLWLLACAAASLASFALLTACSTTRSSAIVVRPPQIEGAEYVGNAGCVDCHAEITQQFPDSVHGRYHRSGKENAHATGCESCHGPASKHIANAAHGGQFIANPLRSPEICTGCHIETAASFHMPYKHPVLEGKMTCVDCHDPHGPTTAKAGGTAAFARVNEACINCHKNESRVHVYEHEALREGCITCHSPHGSPHRKMLKTPDNSLCLTCHGQVAAPGIGRDDLYIGKRFHTTDIGNNSCWAAGCHTGVHGSNGHPRLLY